MFKLKNQQKLMLRMCQNKIVKIVEPIKFPIIKEIMQEAELNPNPPPNRHLTFSIAPMIDISNTHFRYFIRLITKHSPVYT